MISEFLQTNDDGSGRRRRQIQQEWNTFRRGPLLVALAVCALGALITGTLFVILVVKGS